MKAKLIYLAEIALLIFLSIKTDAQDIATDNKGEPIFSVPSTALIKPQLSGNSLGVSFTAVHLHKRMFITHRPASDSSLRLFFVNNDTRKFQNDTIIGGIHSLKFLTLAKSSIINIKASIISSESLPTTFDNKLNLSPHLEIGWAMGLDSLVNPDLAPAYWTASVSGYADYQHLRHYDTLTLQKDTIHKISPGIKVGYTQFFGTNLAISMSGSWQYAIYTDKLTSYQNIGTGFYTNGTIATNGDEDGYVGDLSQKATYRFSLSLPLFFLQLKNVPVYLVPYYFGTYAPGESPNNNAGIVLTGLSQPFHLRNLGARKKKPAVFTFNNTLSLGINLYNHSVNNTNPYFFIAGTLGFDQIKPKTSEQQ